MSVPRWRDCDTDRLAARRCVASVGFLAFPQTELIRRPPVSHASESVCRMTPADEGVLSIAHTIRLNVPASLAGATGCAGTLSSRQFDRATTTDDRTQRALWTVGRPTVITRLLEAGEPVHVVESITVTSRARCSGTIAHPAQGKEGCARSARLLWENCLNQADQVTTQTEVSD